MGLCGEMHDHGYVVLGQDAIHQFAVADISIDKKMPRRVRQVPQVVQVGGIGQRVQVDNIGFRFGTLEVMNEVRSDETRAPGDQDPFHIILCQ